MLIDLKVGTLSYKGRQIIAWGFNRVSTPGGRAGTKIFQYQAVEHSPEGYSFIYPKTYVRLLIMQICFKKGKMFLKLCNIAFKSRNVSFF